MTLRIAHTVASIENEAAGTTQCVVGMARAQKEKGSVSALFSIGGSRRRNTLVDDRRFRNELAGVPLLNKLGHSRAMRQSIVTWGADVVHAHGLWMMPNIYRSPDSLFVIAPHGMLTPVALSFSPWKKWLFQRLFQDRAFAAASLFHATAESEYENIRAVGLTQPVAIIPNGIDVPAMPVPIARSSEKTLLSLGRIHPKKALDHLIRAFAMLADEFPTWRLQIVGPDERGHAGELSRLVTSLAVPRVTIAPPVFGDEKQSLMAAADLFALPSHSENFGMTVAESLALGVPVIATRGTPWAGLETERCGKWIDHGANAMAAALRELMRMPDDARRMMGARGRDWMARDFSWDRMAQFSLDAYAWTLGQADQPNCVRVG